MDTSGNAKRSIAVRGTKFRALVLEATMDCVQRLGFEGVKIADVAEQAGVHETSIYRRWGTRTRLILDATLSQAAVDVPVPDTGSVREDLDMFVRAGVRLAESPSGAALIRSTVLTDSDGDADAIRREFWAQRLSDAEQIIVRAQQRGEVNPNVDPRLVIVTIVGTVQLYATHLGEKMPRRHTDSIVTMILDGIRANPGS